MVQFYVALFQRFGGNLEVQFTLKVGINSESPGRRLHRVAKRDRTIAPDFEGFAGGVILVKRVRSESWREERFCSHPITWLRSTLASRCACFAIWG